MYVPFRLYVASPQKDWSPADGAGAVERRMIARASRFGINSSFSLFICKNNYIKKMLATALLREFLVEMKNGEIET